MAFTEEIKKPFNIVTLILTILSISLSVIFYYKSVKEKSLSYQLNEPSSLIYDSQKSTSSLKIYEKDTVPINHNVYLINGTIWNSGDYSFEKSDIRIPITITLGQSNRIIDYKITKQKDSTVAKFSLSEMTQNSLKINWNYFDPGYGLTFQIIYIGENNPNFKLTGKVLGVDSFKKVEQPERKDFKTKLFFIGLSLLNVIMAVIIVFLSKRIKFIPKFFTILFLFFCIVMLFYDIWIYFLNNTELPI